MRDRKSTTFITCTHTNGCRRLTTTTLPTSTVRQLDQASHSQLKLFTAERETETRSWAIQSSTATSIHTSQKVCGNCGAHTTCSRQAQCLTPTESPLPERAHCRTVKF